MAEEKKRQAFMGMANPRNIENEFAAGNITKEERDALLEKYKKKKESTTKDREKSLFDKAKEFFKGKDNEDSYKKADSKK